MDPQAHREHGHREGAGAAPNSAPPPGRGGAGGRSRRPPADLACVMDADRISRQMEALVQYIEPKREEMERLERIVQRVRSTVRDAQRYQRQKRGF